MQTEQTVQVVLHLVYGKNAIVECGEKGNQHIGVMLDGVQFKVAFIVAVGTFIVPQAILQVHLHGAIGAFGVQHILAL